MGKIALWIVVIIVILLLVRLLKSRGSAGSGADEKRPGVGSAGRGGDRAAGDGEGPRGELMMSCAVCGVHLPASDALFARGRVYCGPEHRDVDLEGVPRDRDGAAREDRE